MHKCNLDQLLAAINNGELEKAYQDLRRYGVILDSEDFEWSGVPVRQRTIFRHKKKFAVSLCRGEVTGIFIC